MKHLAPNRVSSLGAAWAGNSVNCLPFRIKGLLSHLGTRFVSFYDPEGNVVILGLTSENQVQRITIPTEVEPIDAHVAISLGLDSEGHLHIAYGAHSSAVRVLRTSGPGLSKGMPQPVPLNSPFASQMTYPIFLPTDSLDDLLLLFRDGTAASGDIRAMRYDLRSHNWRDDPVPLISGRNSPWESGPYLNRPAVGPNGEIILFLVWRVDPSAATAGLINNSGIDCVVSKDRLRTLSTVHGVELTLPVTTTTAERVIAVPLGSNLINQAASGVRSDGTPMVATYWDDDSRIPQYRIGWRQGLSWRVSTVSRFKKRFRLDGQGTLPLPHSRPELLLEEDGRARMIFRSREFDGRLVMTTLSPPEYSFKTARHDILVNEDLGFYEPVVDHQSWRNGELCVYVQWCDQQSDADQTKTRAQAEAWVMSWARENLS